MRESNIPGGLSFILPGAGQAARGKIWRAYVFLAFWIGSLFLAYQSYVEYLVQTALKSPDAGVGGAIFFVVIAILTQFFSVIENF